MGYDEHGNKIGKRIIPPPKKITPLLEKVAVPCLHCGKVRHFLPAQAEKRKFCSRSCDIEYRNALPIIPRINDSGYVCLKPPLGHPYSNTRNLVLEHRLVMEQHLRQLGIFGPDDYLREEQTVHHINGIRHDNRIENLELWDSAHPKGQRYEEKSEFYAGWLRSYGWTCTPPSQPTPATCRTEGEGDPLPGLSCADILVFSERQTDPRLREFGTSEKTADPGGIGS